MITVIQDIPLQALVPSEANVRRTGVTQGVEELASSIAAHGLLQNLTVRRMPLTPKKAPRYEVIAGGRRLSALKLLAKRKAMAKDAPIPCHVMEDGIAEELSLAENALQCPMHPADQYEAFAKLHDGFGMSAEDIAARFGVTPAVVKQRLKLGAVAPVLMTLYREEEINLDQLTAFAITDDHAAQERVWEALGWDKSREAILDLLSEGQVPSSDRRARFVGLEAYVAAGGTVTRDLFDEDGGGFLSDVALLDRLASEKLEREAAAAGAEGWKWVTTAPEFNYGLTSAMRRVYPEAAPLDTAQQEQVDQLQAQLDALYETEDGDWTDELADQATVLEEQIEALTGDQPEDFRPEDIAIAGAFVCLSADGTPRIERGFIRKEDVPKLRKEANGEDTDAAAGAAPSKGNGLSDALTKELTAFRSLGLREAISRTPSVALAAVVHSLTARLFYDESGDDCCLNLTVRSRSLGHLVKGIDETPSGMAMAERHEAWAKRLPREADELWVFVAGLDQAEQLALLAHCAALCIDAVHGVKGEGCHAANHAMALSQALSLDMTKSWAPTAAGYFARVSKAHILDAVREGKSPEAADNIAKLNKAAMAEAAEERLIHTPWLPEILRTAAA